METQNNESGEKTSKSFLGTIMTHNTTIIAIILSIGAMISNHYEQMEQNAYADSEEIQDERTNNDDKLAEAANKVDEYTMEEDADSTSDTFAGLINEFTAQKDSLDKQEDILTAREEKINTTLEKVKQQWIEQNKEAMMDNGTWLSEILDSKFPGDNTERFIHADKYIRALTPLQIKEAAKILLNNQNVVTAILRPAANTSPKTN